MNDDPTGARTSNIESLPKQSVELIRDTLDDMRKHGLTGGLPQDHAFTLLEEIARLREKNATLRGILDRLVCCDTGTEMGMIITGKAAVEVAREYVAEKRALSTEPESSPETSERHPDTERLDWLDTVTDRMNRRYGTIYGWRYDINHNRAALTNHNLPALTIRQAIDECMAIARPSENGEANPA